ncbi:hypothetical protein [Pseudomonas phage vB_PaeM_PAO1_Ab17]|uniref:Uncharacterized protein n=2 Tax=Nankokuvirus Ab03 TaxID=1925780 RepID=A0A0A1IWU4_9CAUD|nr:hypothetical protein VC54_gp148 [Pseudomonas phage vB_PaeM_PAO1_Ab03]CEF89168.1 hypothetical protein [Pseudomonas phage vB_PaeM_PAO1_Ab03]CEF89552.1 hypothetical protein [Pseudomonas phage vB_PaeM_PAO1_Ab17]
MPYTGDPKNNVVDQLRLMVGDIWDDIEILTDEDYQYFIDMYNGNIRRAFLDVVRSILFKLARYVRERTGDIEVYGSDWWKAYRQTLQDILKDPNLTTVIALPYVGGVSAKDMAMNNANPDNVARKIFIGFNRDLRLYEQQNVGYNDMPRIGKALDAQSSLC